MLFHLSANLQFLQVVTATSTNTPSVVEDEKAPERKVSEGWLAPDNEEREKPKNLEVDLKQIERELLRCICHLVRMRSVTRRPDPCLTSTRDLRVRGDPERLDLRADCQQAASA